MGMFNYSGKGAGTERKPGTYAKLERLAKTFRHEEPDRVPISDFFWGSFTRRWRRDLGLPADANPYYYYDLDLDRHGPQHGPADPAVRDAPGGRRGGRVKTGFETTIRKRFDLPMPEQVSWETDTLEKLEAFEFDDPADRRRFFEAGDNQIAGVGDGFERNSPPWVDTVKSSARTSRSTAASPRRREITHPADRPAQHADVDRRGARASSASSSLRIGEFYLECAKAAIEAADGLLDGFVIWGDVAYSKSTFMKPDYWRDVLQALGGEDHRALPRPRAAGHLPRLRQRPGDLRGHDRDRPRRLQPARGEGRHGRRGAAPGVWAIGSRSAATATSRSGSAAIPTEVRREVLHRLSCRQRRRLHLHEPTTRWRAMSPATPTTRSSSSCASTAPTP